MSIPLFDAHCDTIVAGNCLRRNENQLDFERLRAYSPAAQVFAICTEFIEKADKGAEFYLNKLKSEIKKNSDIVRLCLNSADLDKAISDNKIAAFISVEGAEQISSLEAAYEAGVRIVHPTWNYDNDICGAAMGNRAGLSEHGKEFVHTAQNLGILLDLSHISEQGFWDVIEISEKPVIAGHSNSKTLSDHPRNLTDEQFIALINCAGGAGINLYPEFLGLERNIDAVISHIEHFLSLGGEKSVFLGCDFDGIGITPDGINGVEDLEKLYNELLKRNFTEALVRDIFFNNLRDIIRRTL